MLVWAQLISSIVYQLFCWLNQDYCHCAAHALSSSSILCTHIHTAAKSYVLFNCVSIAKNFHTINFLLSYRHFSSECFTRIRVSSKCCSLKKCVHVNIQLSLMKQKCTLQPLFVIWQHNGYYPKVLFKDAYNAFFILWSLITQVNIAYREWVRLQWLHKTHFMTLFSQLKQCHYGNVWLLQGQY